MLELIYNINNDSLEINVDNFFEKKLYIFNFKKYLLFLKVLYKNLLLNNKVNLNLNMYFDFVDFLCFVKCI